MKNLFLAIGTAALLTACSQNTETNSETTATETTNTEAAVATYGEKITEEGAITPDELLKQLEGKDSVQVKLISEVTSSCTKKGCWMKVETKENEEPIMVTFKDYGFFVPVDTTNPDVNKGKVAVMEGWAFREVMSVEDQKHYAEDAGKTAEEIAKISAPKNTITFVADGVILKN